MVRPGELLCTSFRSPYEGLRLNFWANPAVNGAFGNDHVMSVPDNELVLVLAVIDCDTLAWSQALIVWRLALGWVWTSVLRKHTKALA